MSEPGLVLQQCELEGRKWHRATGYWQAKCNPKLADLLCHNVDIGL